MAPTSRSMSAFGWVVVRGRGVPEMRFAVYLSADVCFLRSFVPIAYTLGATLDEPADMTNPIPFLLL